MRAATEAASGCSPQICRVAREQAIDHRAHRAIQVLGDRPPVSTSHAARPDPISRGSSAASTTDGMPSRTSGMANRVPRAATRRSHAAASSSPHRHRTPCRGRPERRRGRMHRPFAALVQRIEQRRIESVDLLRAVEEDARPRHRVGTPPCFHLIAAPRSRTCRPRH